MFLRFHSKRFVWLRTANNLLLFICCSSIGVHFAWKKDYSWSGSLAVYYKASYGPEVGVLVEALAGLSPDTRSVVFSVPRPGFYTVYVAAEIPGRGFATLLRRHVLASRALPAPDTSPNTVETAPATTLLPGTGAREFTYCFVNLSTKILVIQHVFCVDLKI